MKRNILLLIALIGICAATHAQNLVLHYKLTEQDKYIVDQSGNGNTGEALSGKNCIYGHSIGGRHGVFCFKDPKSKIRSTQAVNIKGENPKTICFWAYCSYNPAEPFYELMTNDGHADDYFQIFIRRRNEIVVNFEKPQAVKVSKKNSKRHPSKSATVLRSYVSFKAPTFSINDNSWHHYTIVCPDKNPENVKVYFDGKELKGNVKGSFVINTNKSRLTFGSKFNGYLSNIKVYNEVLQPAQIINNVKN
ncbi:MAG: LamG domain-containing protein [Prevotellaceae bacterium]|jgi:hypothetical protein|nr:LamG domain-containing protein [Prevotellaceae bacterium]